MVLVHGIGTKEPWYHGIGTGADWGLRGPGC